MSEPTNGGSKRRDFLAQSTAAAALAANAGFMGRAFAEGKDEIKVGLIGCGGRGSGAAVNAIEADKGVRVVALADVFKDRLESARNAVASKKQNVSDDNCFVGFDAFQKLLKLDLDYVILATPPHFRAEHFEAAVNAGKHVFMEKPVAVDPFGCRRVIAAGEEAKKKKLSVVAGTQRRHQASYLQCYERIRDGLIGNIVSARCYWNMNQLWSKKRTEKENTGWNDMEWMIRDWVNWRWLSGDHIVEQHVHNLDVVNWFLSKDGTVVHPTRAVGMGGRAHRPTGDQFDFFAVDFEYDGGVHVASYCRQINDCDQNVSEHINGEKGYTNCGNSISIGRSTAWKYDAAKTKARDPYVQEHVDLIKSIRENQAINEAKNVATSTLTAIMGRIAAYTGKPVTWQEIYESDMRLGPKEYNWDAVATVEIPKPGRS